MQEVPKPKKINDSVWEFCNPKDPGPTIEIIFCHGIQLQAEATENSHLSTWTKKGSTTEYWPQTFFERDEFLTGENIRVRALTAAFDASKFKTGDRGRLDLYLIAERFVQSIIENPRVKVGQTENVPVILVGHSFGGLLIKKILEEVVKKSRREAKVKSFLDNLAGVFFYATPHVALKDEVFQQLFPKEGNVDYSKLVDLFEQLNKFCARLEERMILIAKMHGIRVQEVFEAKETNLGYWNGKIVEEGSARGAAHTSSVIDEDHFNICRPENVESDSYQILANFIYDICEKVKGFADGAVEMELDLPSVPTVSVRSQ